MLISRREKSPPTITSANGRCESEPTPRRERGGEQAERRDEGGHQDRTEAEQRGLARRRGDAESLLPELVGVGDEHDGGLHRDAEQREEADARRHRERRAAQPQREHAADRRGEQHAATVITGNLKLW